MPVRLRITLLFVLLAFIILFVVCSGIYYFSYLARIDNIKTRLTNRAITTARLLSQREIFDQALIQRIDSSTTIALKNKIIIAFADDQKVIYSYSSQPQDSIKLPNDLFNKVKTTGSY